MRVIRKGSLVFIAVLVSTLALSTLALIGNSPFIATAQTHAGATVPYVEIEAENTATNGTTVGPDRTLHTLASEASGRRAVTLSAQGQFVEFTLPQQANSIVMRYSITDSADGRGITAPLSLYINGQRQTDLTLTSSWSWRYGGYQFTNNPGSGNPFHMYDEVHRLTGQMAAGSKVRLQVDPGDTAPSYTIDLADFEQVAAPLTQPAGYLSVTDYGADPSGAQDSTSAIRNAVNAGMAQGKGVWIPQGNYTLTGQIQSVNNVTIQGAGMWYSTLHFTQTSGSNTVGVFGNYLPSGVTGVQATSASQNVKLSDFAILGEINQRVDGDQTNAIGGAFSNSTIQNIWIEHTKVGLWLDGPMDKLTIQGMRIRDTIADGVNFHQGVTNSTVTNSVLRNIGDDGLAMWSEHQADANDSFTFDTVQEVVFANDIAIYGGQNNSITDSFISDGGDIQGGGLHVGNRFSSVPLSGTTTVARNTTLRSGDLDPNWQFGVGALWFYGLDSAMTGTINVINNEFDDSSYEAIMFIGTSVTNVAFANNNVNGTGTFVLQLQSGGSASFSGITASNIGSEHTVHSAIYSCEGANFTMTAGTGNGSWINDTPYCGPWPAPFYVPIATFTPTATFTTTATNTPCPGVCPSKTPTNTPTSTPTNTPTPTLTPTITPVPGTPIVSINAGGGASGIYVADTDFDQGNQFSDASTVIDTSKVLDSNPAPQAVYQTVRWNANFTYTIPGLTPGANYTVLLHWAELTWTAAGQRVFNVAINGNPALSNFDVFANAGFKEALSKAIPATANGSGQIVIAFTRGTADNPFINGIQVFTQSAVTATPTSTNTRQITFQPPTNTQTPTSTATPGSSQLAVAINAGGGASGSYVADTDFDQGNQFSDTSTAIDTSGGLDSNPAPQAVYQTVRWNAAFTYTIPGLTPGAAYTVRLHWAELTFQTAGARAFNTTINGNSALSNFDVFATAGFKKALSRSFAATANGSGQIVIAFSRGSADNPFVNGIEVLLQSSVTLTPTKTPVPLHLVLAINAGGGASGSYVADTDFNQGNQFSDTSTAIDTSAGLDSNPAPQAVYQACRWNASFTYTIPGLTPGAAYTVQLHWAELSFQAAGARVFNVAINGNAALSNFDVFAAAGFKKALGRSFTTTANGSGQIIIAFSRGSADNPFISGIEVLQ